MLKFRKTLHDSSGSLADTFSNKLVMYVNVPWNWVRGRVLRTFYNILSVFKSQKTQHDLTGQHKTPSLSQKQELLPSVFESNVLCFRSRKCNEFLSRGKPTYTRTSTDNRSTWYRLPVSCLRGVVSIRKHLQEKPYQSLSLKCNTELTSSINVLQDTMGCLPVDSSWRCTVFSQQLALHLKCLDASMLIATSNYPLTRGPATSVPSYPKRFLLVLHQLKVEHSAWKSHKTIFQTHRQAFSRVPSEYPSPDPVYSGNLHTISVRPSSWRGPHGSTRPKIHHT